MNAAMTKDYFPKSLPLQPLNSREIPTYMAQRMHKMPFTSHYSQHRYHNMLPSYLQEGTVTLDSVSHRIELVSKSSNSSLWHLPVTGLPLLHAFTKQGNPLTSGLCNPLNKVWTRFSFYGRKRKKLNSTRFPQIQEHSRVELLQ